MGQFLQVFGVRKLCKSLPLRTGLTTGTCAAAAAAAAMETLFSSFPKTVEIILPSYKKVILPVYSIKSEICDTKCQNTQKVIAKIQKDGGDDPDVTNKAIIGAIVEIKPSGKNKIYIRGGKGIGKVTRSGLSLPVGKYAINPVPLEMIKNAIQQRIPASLKEYTIFVTIFVERGEELAEKTLNKRLGIIGGLSILGTTGIVKPYSTQSYKDTITICMKSAKIQGTNKCALSTGRGSEKRVRNILPDLPEASFILIADFFEFSITQAIKLNFHSIILSCFFGKLSKWAMELEYTHAHTKQTDFSQLANFASEEGLSKEFCQFIRRANTAREIYESNWIEKEEFIRIVGKKALKWAYYLAESKTKEKPTVNIKIYCWDFRYKKHHEWKN